MSLLARRRAMMGAKSEQGLPGEYQQVEWIGHAKNYARISGITPYYNVRRIELDVEFTNASSAGTAIIVAKSDCAFPVGATNNASSLQTPSQRGYDCSPVTAVSGAITRDIYTFTKVTGASIPNSFTLLGYNNQSFNCGLQAFGAKMYDATNKLIFDAVPCYRKSDSVIGIYDLVAQQFFPVTSTWTKGADVT